MTGLSLLEDTKRLVYIQNTRIWKPSLRNYVGQRDHVMYNKQTQIPSLKLYPLLREDNSRTNARVKVYSHHGPIFKN